jgi:hypothetical protein
LESLVEDTSITFINLQGVITMTVSDPNLSLTDPSQSRFASALETATTVTSPQTAIPPSSSSSDLPAAPQEQVFDLRSFAGKVVRGLFNSVSDAGYNNSVGVYRIENAQGTVIDPANGQSYAPGDTGYSSAALRRSQFDGTTFSARAGDFTAELRGGAIYAPFLVANDTVANALQGSNANVFFNFTGANSDGYDHFQFAPDGKIGVEDLLNGGDQDFNDAVFSATFEDAMKLDTPPQSEDQVVDLRSQVGKTLKALINTTSITADYNDTVGLYRIEDAVGTVIDPTSGQSYKPGDPGYGLAIVRRSQADGVSFSAKAGDVTANLAGGSLYATYLVSNGTVDDVLSGKGPNVYSNFVAANSDNFDHFTGPAISGSGTTTFSIEDLPGGGDRDFNDANLTITFEPA